MGRNLSIPPSVKPGIPKLGVKPDGWQEVAFKDILDVVVRPAVVKPNRPYQLINAKRNRGGIVPRAMLLGKQIKTTTQFFVASGDFVISRRQIVHGACGIVPPELEGALVSNEYSTLVPKEGLLLTYLGYYAHTIHFQQTCFNSSIGVAIEKMVFNLDHWLRHRLYLPPLEYQHKVVRILSTIDRAIAGVEKLIAAKRMLKKGLAQQLLTGRRRLPGFKKSWKQKRLGDFSRCYAGGTPSTDKDYYYGGDIPWITSSDLNKSNIYEVEGRLTQCGLENSAAKVIEPETLIIALYGATAGVTAISKIRAAINQAVLAIIPSSVDPQFLYYKLQAQKDWIISTFTQGGQPNLSGEIVKSLIISFPEIDEQCEIISVLRFSDRGTLLLEKKLDALQKLKVGLMQKLLTRT